MSSFPIHRPRRLRRTEALRGLVRETVVRPQDLVLPLFVIPGTGVRRPVSSMPGVFNTSVDEAVRDAREAFELGIPAVLLFGIPPHKDEKASGAFGKDGIVQQAVRAIKRELPELLVITDVCLCEYTSHGHCGIVRNGTVANDETLELLARQAVHHARAGADVVAPSDMMDGRVGVIRATLDEEGFADTAILAYSAKYASAFYGPFREAAQSAPQFGGRRAYQMDPPNAEEAIREVALDIEEGADMVMVKPALAYLDIIRRVKDEFGYPLAAYHVSGEYSMIMAAGQLGWLDAERAMAEAITSIRRAGADVVITYWAREMVRYAERRAEGPGPAPRPGAQAGPGLRQQWRHQLRSPADAEPRIPVVLDVFGRVRDDERHEVAVVAHAPVHATLHLEGAQAVEVVPADRQLDLVARLAVAAAEVAVVGVVVVARALDEDAGARTLTHMVEAERLRVGARADGGAEDLAAVRVPMAHRVVRGHREVTVAEERRLAEAEVHQLAPEARHAPVVLDQLLEAERVRLRPVRLSEDVFQ